LSKTFHFFLRLVGEIVYEIVTLTPATTNADFFQNWTDLDKDTDALLDSILTGNGCSEGSFETGCDVINADDDFSARLSFDDAASDDSGLEQPPMVSPLSLSQVTSPEPCEPPEVYIG
jgi:hypothetical protein